MGRQNAPSGLAAFRQSPAGRPLRRFRVAALDMRGHGETCTDDDGDLSAATLVQVALPWALLEQACVDRHKRRAAPPLCALPSWGTSWAWSEGAGA